MTRPGRQLSGWRSSGSWWATGEPPKRPSTFLDNRATILASWDARFQDRQDELVFIGQDMDETRTRQELAACLCPEAEIARWQRGGDFAYPWPQF